MDRIDGKRVVITGATSGIGRATAKALAKLGANLVLVSRNKTIGTALARQLEKLNSNTSAGFVEADLSSFDQVRNAANQIRERWSSIDILINNAGARFDVYAKTPDNCERTLATNHLGHFLLTSLLLDQLTAAPAAKIITVSSSAATQAVNDGHWQYGPHDYDRKQAYAKSKLANLLFAFELAHRLADTAITSLAVDPGVVATHFARNNGLVPWLKHLLYHARRGELVRPAQGADTVIFLATSTLPEPATGGYFRQRQEIRACRAAYDVDAAAKLWEMSASLTGFDPLPTKSPQTHM